MLPEPVAITKNGRNKASAKNGLESIDLLLFRSGWWVCLPFLLCRVRAEEGEGLRHKEGQGGSIEGDSIG